MRRLLCTLALLLLCAPVLAGPAPGPRMVAEWEPAHGTLVRWPLGIPLELAVELARDDTLHTLVETSGAEQQARATFAGAGIDLGRVNFIRGDLWSMWTRDWGPQAVFDAQGVMAYADPWFDGYPWVSGCDLASPAAPRARVAGARAGRGYEEDDALPAVVAAALGVPLAPLPAYLTGGNVMTDGLGGAWSTRQMLDENAPFMSESEFRQRAADVLGVDDYRFVIEPEVHGIQHIDCYAKLLDEETVLVKEVPAWHPEAACCDAVAAAFANATTGYGRPFQVLRIFCDVYEGAAAAAYTNALILNRKVLVPLFGIAADQDALATYEAAMPGYQVLGFAHDGWYDYDALHCRTMGLFDPGMLRLLHAPLESPQPAGAPVRVAAWIDDRAGAGLPPAGQVLRWRLAGEATWHAVPLASAPGDTFVAEIPAQAPGAAVVYRLEAADADGRAASLPRGDMPAAYSFTVTDQPLPAPHGAAGPVLTAAPNPFNPRTVLRLAGADAAATSLAIHDLRGRLVRRLIAAPTVAWDGRDAAGRALPSGAYLAVAETPAGRVTARLLLQR